jgi:hypothetical protein
MRTGHRVLTVAAGLLACGAVVAGPASADVPQPTASYAGGVIQASGGAAVVRITYTCTTATPDAQNHLYVALKQGAGISPENTSSKGAATYYSTNWKSDTGPNALTCDGRQHTQAIVLKADAAFTPTAPVFSSGTALLQVCVFDNITGVNAQGEPTGGFALDYTMQPVHSR